jgi:endonuclease YncB( thermonuclease family)
MRRGRNREAGSPSPQPVRRAGPSGAGEGARAFSVRALIAAVALAALVGSPSAASAHRSGCHRWHPCPPDTGSYVCGDLGYCSQCPDNQFCQDGRPRTSAGPPLVAPTPEAPARAPTPGAALRREPATVVRVVDGDTLDVRVGGRVERVRLIGLDPPESVDPRRPTRTPHRPPW